MSLFVVAPWTPSNDASSGSTPDACPVSPPTLLVCSKSVCVVDVDGAESEAMRAALVDAGADAYVRTDRGMHAFWLSPRVPPEAFVATFGDAAYAACTAKRGRQEIFFRSKTTGQKRHCVALTLAGEAVADAYNRAVEEAE